MTAKERWALCPGGWKASTWHPEVVTGPPALASPLSYILAVFPSTYPRQSREFEVNAQVTQEWFLERPASLPLPRRTISCSNDVAIAGAGSDWTWNAWITAHEDPHWLKGQMEAGFQRLPPDLWLPQGFGKPGSGSDCSARLEGGPRVHAIVRPFLLSRQAMPSDVPEVVSMPGPCWVRSISVTSEESRPSWWGPEDAHLLRPGGWCDESSPLSLKLPEQGCNVHGSNP